jgi:hypothetical protein
MRQCVSSSSTNRLSAYEIFISRIQTLQRIYAQAGYFIRALSLNPNARDRFLSLPVAKQNQINAKLSNDLDFYLGCIEKKERLNNVKNIVEILAYWRRLHIPEGAMERIQPNSLVEIYDQDLIQRYRSANFFSYTSHSLEDLESRPYFELFKKSQAVEQSITDFVTKVLRGQQHEPDYTSVGKHRLWEINSPKKLVTQNKTTALSPIFHEEDGSLAGFVHICSVLSQTELTLVKSDDIPPPAAIDLSLSRLDADR